MSATTAPPLCGATHNVTDGSSWDAGPYIDTLDIACRACDATFAATELHVCPGSMTDHDADEVIGAMQHYQTRGGRKLAHSYRDELYPPRQPIEPTIFTRRDLFEIVVGVPILAALMFGLPFLLWLLAVQP